MSPVTHFLASWALAERFGTTPRERFWITFAGVAPDLDGLGIVLDAANHLLGRPESHWFSTGHHLLLHGALGCVALVGCAVLFGCRSLRATGWVAAFHLHLLCDIVGSRGPGPADFWPVCYWAPVVTGRCFVWNGQWALNAWPNFAFTVLLIGWGIYRAIRSGLSPVSLFSPRWNEIVVATLRNRFGGRNPED